MNDSHKLRIIFMGTPEFALAALSRLLESGYNIVSVVTAPDKAAGRGMQLQQSAVKKYALENNIHVLQPEKLKDPAFIEEMRMVNADLNIVVAFRMLPEIIWNMPPLGTINVHASLLPQYRGAAPINWAIINGEKYSGVTTFKLKHDIDTGNILLSEKIPITASQTAGELHDILKEAGAELLIKTIDKLEAGDLKEIEQQNESAGNENVLKHAPKIFTETCRINWNQPVQDVFNLIRGLSPVPAAFTMLDNKKLKIFMGIPLTERPSIAAGEIDTDEKTYLRFACSDGYISLTDLQLEGKKRMKIREFLRGYRFSTGFND